MIPKTYRHITNALLKKVDMDDSFTLNDVAKSLMIPEAVLRFFKNLYKL